MSVLKSGDADPRNAMDAEALDNANQPVLSPVAMPAGLSPGMKLGFVGIGLLGILTFTTLATSRGDANQTNATTLAPAAASVSYRHSARRAWSPQAVLKPGPPELPPPSLVPPPLDANGAPILGVVGPRAVGANRFQSPGVVVDLTKGGVALLTPTPRACGRERQRP